MGEDFFMPRYSSSICWSWPGDYAQSDPFSLTMQANSGLDLFAYVGNFETTIRAMENTIQPKTTVMRTMMMLMLMTMMM